jgi:hypothetical protein
MVRTFLLVACIIVCPASADAQVSACNDAEVVFVGRVDSPITFLVSGEKSIEQARQNVVRVEEEVARERAALDLQTRLERNLEFELRLLAPQQELNQRRAMYPPPHELTFTPVQVERALRGVIEGAVMLFWRDPSIVVTPGELFLIYGRRSRDLIPPFPEMSDIPFAEYVEITGAVPAASAQRALLFLTSTSSGSTILGTLTRHSYGGVGQPLPGIRIEVVTQTQTFETATSDDGSFAASSLRPGRLEIRAFLPKDLTIINKAELVKDVLAGCSTVELTADLNGRVRGRVVNAWGGAVKGITVHLSGVDPTAFAELQSRHANENLAISQSHAPRLQTHAREDGTYEFTGVPPGSYVLSAGVEQVVNGKRQYIATFFPGAERFVGATLVVVGTATEHDGFDFVVKTE